MKEYWNDVFVNVLRDYQHGNTPNPDVLCNQKIKFGALYQDLLVRRQLGDNLATGHYAKVDADGQLFRGVDPIKDQSYYLCQVQRNLFRRSIFPLGHLHKSQVKAMAQDAGLEFLLRKKESTGLCFVGERPFHRFLSEYLIPQPGLFRNVDTHEVLGEHQGVHLYTIGQRARLKNCAKRFYVVAKELATKTLWATSDPRHPKLFTQKVMIQSEFDLNQASSVKPRYREVPRVCKVRPVGDDEWEVHFDRPTYAVASGQIFAFYHGELCIGGGTVKMT